MRQTILRWTTLASLLAIPLWPALGWLESARGAVVATEYTPVAPPVATNRALELSLEILDDWIDQKDYASAGESCRELEVMVWLYQLQSDEPMWKEQIQKLDRIVDRLSDEVQAKNAKGCKEGIKQFAEQLAKMKANPPKNSKPAPKNLRLVGTTKTWMLMMDSAYTEGKLADDAEHLAIFAEALAEELNAVGFMRSRGDWKTIAHEARDLALEAAKVARRDGLAAAKPILKRANQRCEVCHKRK